MANHQKSIRRLLEGTFEWLFIRMAGGMTIFILFALFAFILWQALPLFLEVKNPWQIFSANWYPLSGVYGTLALIFGSLFVALMAMGIAVPLAIAVAIFLSEIAPNFLPWKVCRFLKILIELLASVPSVVFGFIGILILGPFLEKLLGLKSGLNAFTAAFLLAFMALPTIASVIDEALQNVPEDYKAASYALGASPWQTLWNIMLPATLPGIFAGVMLGFGRVIGETMTVMMVAGGSAQITLNPFSPVRTMTGTIAAEMGEVIMGDTHYHSLFLLGAILFIISFVLNTLAARVVRRIYRKRHGI